MKDPDEKIFDFEDKSTGNFFSFDFRKIFHSFKQGWKIILLSSVIGSVIGILIGFSIPKTFTSTAIVAPELTTRSNAGGMISLSNLAGINLNSVAITDAMHTDIYPAIIKSIDFRLALLDMPVSFVSSKEGQVNTTLCEYLLNYTKSPWWTPVLNAPATLKDKIVSLFRDEDEDIPLINCNSDSENLYLTKEQEAAVAAILSAVSVSVDKRTYILTITTKLQDRMIAAQLANYVIDKLQQFVIDYRMKKSIDAAKYYETMVEESRIKYLEAQQRYAFYLDSHQGLSKALYQVEAQKLQSEANLRLNMYNSMNQNFLQAQARVQLENPVLVVIQNAYANRIGKPSKMKFALLFFIIGIIAGTVIVVIRFK